MKRINKILGLGIGIVAAFGLASCTNETTVVDPETPGNDVEEVTLNLVKTPDFYAWSGKQVLGDTRATRGTYTENGKTYYRHDEEVEVNLSILDQKTWGIEDPKITDLAAKLSVHVRQAVENLTVKLAIPAEYIIDSDDLAIFKSHYNVPTKDEISHQEHSVTYNIGKGVTASVEMPALTIEDGTDETQEGSATLSGPIEVNITGLTSDVINECMTDNQDGINFEIYIYIQTDFDTNYTTEGFKSELEESTISFEEAPKYYINAFGLKYNDGEKTSEINPNDCTVTLVDEDSYYLIGRNNLDHLNGSSFNTIYMLKIEGADGDLVDPTPDHAHGGAIEVPSQGNDENDGDQQPETDDNGEESENEGDGE